MQNNLLDPTRPADALLGRDISAQNARRHGLCSEKALILADENVEDYNAIKNAWFNCYKPKEEAEIRLVQQLVDADWFSERANRTVAEVEAQIYNCGYAPINWSDDNHLKLARFQRYQTAKANIVIKCRKAVEDFRKNRTNATVKADKHEIYKEKSKPEPTIEELIQQMKQRKIDRDRTVQFPRQEE